MKRTNRLIGSIAFVTTLLSLVGTLGSHAATPTGGPDAIRPFRVHVPEEQVVELRQRIAATRWPDKETVQDRSQGVQLAKLQALVSYWGTDYDWRKAEAQLNALPQFVTKIDGLDIHFIHVRSRNPNALPLIITHGWPGSILEQVKVIEPLTNPTAHGGKAEDSFDVVIPSMPGYGFSERPQSTGWGPHKVLIELEDANHRKLDEGTVTFVIPGKAAAEKDH